MSTSALVIGQSAGLYGSLYQFSPSTQLNPGKIRCQSKNIKSRIYQANKYRGKTVLYITIKSQDDEIVEMVKKLSKFIHVNSSMSF